MSVPPLRLVAVALVAFAACAVQAQDSAQVEDDEAVPFGLLDHDVPPLLPPIEDGSGARAAVCFIDESSLATVATAVDPPVGLDDVIATLAEPPSLEGRSLRTAVGDPPLVRDVRLVGGIAQVDLLPAISTLAGDEQLLAVAQLVCTLTGQPGVGPVSFTLEGAPVDVPRGDGSLTSAPVSRDDYADLLG
jgi:hypothetical protein